MYTQSQTNSINNSSNQFNYKMAIICKISLIYGEDIYLTSYPENLEISGNTYLGNTLTTLKGTWSNITNNIMSLKLSSNYNLSNILDYIHAKIQIYDYDYTKCISIPISSGQIFQIDNQMILFSTLSDPKITTKYSRTCRAAFCDSGCGLNLSSFGSEFTVKKQPSNYSIELHETIGDPKKYKFGKIKIAGSTNSILRIANVTSSYIELYHPISIESGAKVILYEGCDKMISTCRNRFRNIHNFRGEPG